jgi:hypothetical protein
LGAGQGRDYGQGLLRFRDSPFRLNDCLAPTARLGRGLACSSVYVADDFGRAGQSSRERRVVVISSTKRAVVLDKTDPGAEVPEFVQPGDKLGHRGAERFLLGIWQAGAAGLQDRYGGLSGLESGVKISQVDRSPFEVLPPVQKAGQVAHIAIPLCNVLASRRQ